MSVCKIPRINEKEAGLVYFKKTFFVLIDQSKMLIWANPGLFLFIFVLLKHKF